MTEMTSPEQVAALETGRIDAGLARSPVVAGGIGSRIVRREPLIAALPAGHRLAAGSSIVLGDLRDERSVSFPRSLGPGLYRRIVSLCASAGFTPISGKRRFRCKRLSAWSGRVRGRHRREQRATSGCEVSSTDRWTNRTRPPKLALVWQPDQAPPVLERFTKGGDERRTLR